MQGYNQNLSTYLLQDVTNRQILSMYQGQLQNTSAPISSLTPQITERLAQPTLETISQPISVTTQQITQPVQTTVNQVTQTTQSVVPQTVNVVNQPVQQVIQQVPQVIQSITSNNQSSSTTQKTSGSIIAVPTIKLPL